MNSKLRDKRSESEAYCGLCKHWKNSQYLVGYCDVCKHNINCANKVCDKFLNERE